MFPYFNQVENGRSRGFRTPAHVHDKRRYPAGLTPHDFEIIQEHSRRSVTAEAAQDKALPAHLSPLSSPRAVGLVLIEFYRGLRGADKIQVPRQENGDGDAHRQRQHKGHHHGRLGPSFQWRRLSAVLQSRNEGCVAFGLWLGPSSRTAWPGVVTLGPYGAHIP